MTDSPAIITCPGCACEPEVVAADDSEGLILCSCGAVLNGANVVWFDPNSASRPWTLRAG